MPQRFSSNIGGKIKTLLDGQVISASGLPCSILFPASHGFGLVFSVVLRFLVDRNNEILVKLKGATNVELSSVGCNEIVDDALLVAVSNKVSPCLA